MKLDTLTLSTDVDLEGRKHVFIESAPDHIVISESLLLMSDARFVFYDGHKCAFYGENGSAHYVMQPMAIGSLVQTGRLIAWEPS